MGTGDSLDGSYDDPKGSLLGSGDDSLDGPDDDLTQRVDEGLQHVAGVQGAQHPAPEEQAVDELPVVHRLVGVLLNAQTHTQR